MKMTSMYDVLKASKGVPVNDIFAALWGRKLSGDYTIVTYTGTLPATLTGTKAGYLHRYKIYGNTEQTGTPTPENPVVPQECGERTENLIDVSMITTGYTLDGATGLPTVSQNRAATLTPIAVSSDNAVIKLSYSGEGTCMIMYSVLNDNTLVRRTYSSDNPYTIDTSGGDTLYVGVFILEGTAVDLSKISNLMLVPGSTAPSSYIPYGYKLPLTSGSTPVDIYIGDDTLSTDEYVDSSTGKIYRMVSGVLTPVDPPVPFPALPTTAGSTNISWAGSGLAPSQAELEYECKK
jgi:hypothetical protein